VSRKFASRVRLLTVTVLLLLPGVVTAAKLKIKKIEPDANPPQYVAFSRLLPKNEQYRHALERLTFGPRAGDMDEIRQIGLQKWLDLQLHPARIPENPVLAERLRPFSNLSGSLFEVKPPAQIAEELSEAKLLRAIYSKRQLEELLTDFWYNHFNVFWGKGTDRFLVPAYESEAIRPHVFGNFYDLLLATAKSPAMLVFLDNAQSVGPMSVAAEHARGRNRRGLNENYGRELMELHTLGVNGGYTQRDVIEVARCFTGWTIVPPRRGGGFEYNDRMHDPGRKVVLGHVIAAGGGMNDGLEVLKILAHHPATAHHVSFELAQRFVADDPPPSLVNRMAKTFLTTGGDLRQVMETMLDSGEFWSQGAYGAKIKSPFEMVASAMRATNADVTSALTLSREMNRLGEPLYRKLEPVGYSNANSEWVSSAGLLERMNFALALAQNRIPGVHVDASGWEAATHGDTEQIERLVLGRDASGQTEAAIEQAVQKAHNAQPDQVLGLVAGLALGSPDFQQR
jgi:uncharacterized protein (DUF1800 family)